jgi:hypothetical protein
MEEFGMPEGNGIGDELVEFIAVTFGSAIIAVKMMEKTNW